MAKYTFIMSCGHEDTVEISGKGADRERRIEYLKNHGICRDCYKKKMQEKMENMPLTINVCATPNIDENDGQVLFSLYFDGNTIEIKDKIKELGYYWGESLLHTMDMLSSKRKMAWQKTVRENEVKEELMKAVEIGAVENFSEDIQSKIDYQYALKKQDNWKKIKAEIDKIQKPKAPAVLSGHTWNQKIYGKSGNYSVYPDGEKTVITDEQAEEIREYLIKKEEYRKKVEEVKNAQKS